jgi:hypothetical protein
VCSSVRRRWLSRGCCCCCYSVLLVLAPYHVLSLFILWRRNRFFHLEMICVLGVPCVLFYVMTTEGNLFICVMMSTCYLFQAMLSLFILKNLGESM